MIDHTMEIRNIAAELLRDGKVDLVVGYEEGSIPLHTKPAFVRSPEEAEKLVFDARCGNNLATYLRGKKERIGVVAKGCDARAIVVALMERQLDRERLVIVGVPCDGVLDQRRIDGHLDSREVLGIAIENGDVVLQGEDFEERLPVAEYLCESCATCRHRNASVLDIAVGESSDSLNGHDPYAKVRELEAQSAAERWAYFAEQFTRCIRCYACRQACPVCYCNVCVVDQAQPGWFGKTEDPSDTMTFHLTRALHTAGRCVDCGACVRACPMGIDLRALNLKMTKDVEEWYGYTAGLDLETAPPLSTFAQDDPQEFIR